MNHHWPNWTRKLLSCFSKYPIQRKWDCFYYWRGKLLSKYKLTEMESMNTYKFKYIDQDCVPAEVDKYMKTNTIECKSTRKKIIIGKILAKFPKIIKIFNIVKIK